MSLIEELQHLRERLVSGDLTLGEAARDLAAHPDLDIPEHYALRVLEQASLDAAMAELIMFQIGELGALQRKAADSASALGPFWLRFWPPVLIACGIGLMFGASFSSLYWPGVLVLLVGAALSAAYLFRTKKMVLSPGPGDSNPRA
ncbi:hypothetical protein [Nocardiopsis synnemataformans]|uniref:hypothetical protein n=1 Tax=Nocardiopsis synnemataformans TaxID=61305 RepID=UPI003EBCC190